MCNKTNLPHADRLSIVAPTSDPAVFVFLPSLQDEPLYVTPKEARIALSEGAKKLDMAQALACGLV